MSQAPTAGPERKLAPPGDRLVPDLERVEDGGGPRWMIRSVALARQVLRDEDGFRQAGFLADRVGAVSRMRPPILYLEGPDHRAQRRASARLFAPTVVEGYRPMMEALSRELVGGLRRDADTDLTRLSLRMSVEVVARVVGLTHSSRRGMARRLGSFFDTDFAELRRTPRGLLRTLRGTVTTSAFYWRDVKPAIRAHRRHPADDVISQLLDAGFSDVEILTEALTYGAAGMVTTREFITVGAWHLCTDDDLRARFRAAPVPERRRILEEALRLEPVVGHLLRRATRPVRLDGVGTVADLGAGDLVDIAVRAANADAAVVGTDPLRLCPGRELPRGVPAAVLGFGDGHHRCPGGPMAIMETEIFLSTLFADDVVAAGPPEVRWNPISQGYDLDRFLVRRA